MPTLLAPSTLRAVSAHKMTRVLAPLSMCLLPHMAYSMSEAPAPEVIEPEIVSNIGQETQNVSVIDDVTAVHESMVSDGSHLAIWQGMNHEWKRFIVDSKNGRIPHRISKLENYISQDALATQLTFNMGENTGVDGNYMYPKSHAALLDVSSVSVAQGKVALKWSDSVSDVSEQVGSDEYVPQAKNRVKYSLELPDLPWQEGASSVFLQGISLETYCSDLVNDDTCNSDGMWPYLYHVSIDQCQASSVEGTQCDLNVNIYRSWTPNYGGFQLIGEVKPINRQLDFDLTVFYAGLSGEGREIAVSDVTTAKYEHELQDFESSPKTVSLVGGGDKYNSGVAAITGFGFVLTEPETINAGWKMLGSDVNQRGRYIARKQFEVDSRSYDNSKYVQDFSVNMNLWAPTTVVESDVTAEMNLQLIELQTSSGVNQNKSVEGKICINSKDAAPFFSKWKKCDKQTAAAIKKFGGVEKAETEISVMLTE